MSHSEPEPPKTCAERMLDEYEQRVTKLGLDLDDARYQRDYWKKLVALEKGVKTVKYRADTRCFGTWTPSANKGLYGELFDTERACYNAIDVHGSKGVQYRATEVPNAKVS